MNYRLWQRGDGYEWKHVKGGSVDLDAVTGWWVAYDREGKRIASEFYVDDARRLVEFEAQT